MKEEFESLKNFISELFKGFSKPENKKDERPEVRVLDAPEVQARLAGLENSIAQAIQARETAEAELAALKNSIGLKDTELLALRAENDRLKAGGLKDQAPNGDPDRALTAEEQEWQSLGSELRSSLSPGERALIGQNAARRNTRQ